MSEPLKYTIDAREIELQKRTLRLMQTYFKTFATLAAETIGKCDLSATSVMLANANAEYAKIVNEQLEGLLRIAPDPK